MSIRRMLSSALILVLIGLLLPITVQASHQPLPADPTVQQGATWTATVIVARLNVRRAPRITSNILGKLNLADKVTVTGRNDNATWLQIKLGTVLGWVAHEWVTLDNGDSRFNLPITNVYPPYLTVTAEPSVNVRMGPLELFPVVTRLRSFVDVDVIALHSRPLWYQIAMPGNGPIGWVRGDTMLVTGDLTTVPERNGIAMAQVVSYRVHVRSTPLLNAPVLGNVRIDQFYQIVGLDARRNWWQIQTSWGKGWILAEFVKVFGNMEDLPETMTVPLQGQS